jgi:hypothetical protein
VARVLDEDELIEHWALVGDELSLLTGRTGSSKLGLALWLKFAPGHGCSSGREVKASVPVSSLHRARLESGGTAPRMTY